MKLLVYDRRKELVEWAETRIAGCKFRDDAQAIGITDPHGSIIASTVFDTFSTTSCFISVAAEPGHNWVTKRYLTACFAYPFIQCDFRRVTCVISELNEPSLKFTRHVGWVQEGIIRKAGHLGEDVIIFGMLREECRWIAPTLRRAA